MKFSIDDVFYVCGNILTLTIVFWLGRKSRQVKINDLEESYNKNSKYHNETIIELNKINSKLKTELAASQERAKKELQEQKERLNKINSKLKEEVAASQEEAGQLKATNSKLHKFYSTTLENLRNEGAVLPSLVRWANTLKEKLDRDIVYELEVPPYPAPSAAKQVKESRGLARQWQQEAELLRNRLELYEAQAPWLIEYAEYSLDEIIAGLQEEREIRCAYKFGDDPVKLFLTPNEIKKLSDSERNQLALDRYWESSRKRSAWTAGIQYERYIGYLYEKEGLEVEYHGALRGKEDGGIDLVCRNNELVKVIQCKRLSAIKGRPVRENVVAQIYGSAMFFAMRSALKPSLVKPVVITTYEVSEEAKKFAQILGVEIREKLEFQVYPCIKCNISARSGKRIYHLPFDQQYDSTKISSLDGKFYAMTIMEAEEAGFRRAFRWQGN